MVWRGPRLGLWVTGSTIISMLQRRELRLGDLLAGPPQLCALPVPAGCPPSASGEGLSLFPGH